MHRMRRTSSVTPIKRIKVVGIVMNSRGNAFV